MWAAELSQNERFLWPMAVFAGILMCKIVYDATGWISSSYVKGYNKLSKAVKVEWNNRGFSTFHALLVASASFYLLLFSDVFQNDSYAEQMIDGKSTLSDTILGRNIKKNPLPSGYHLAREYPALREYPPLGGYPSPERCFKIAEGLPQKTAPTKQLKSGVKKEMGPFVHGTLDGVSPKVIHKSYINPTIVIRGNEF
ncbi:hypothetical protein AAC387_Pa01g2402 [Persea americana]